MTIVSVPSARPVVKKNVLRPRCCARLARAARPSPHRRGSSRRWRRRWRAGPPPPWRSPPGRAARRRAGSRRRRRSRRRCRGSRRGRSAPSAGPPPRRARRKGATEGSAPGRASARLRRSPMPPPAPTPAPRQSPRWRRCPAASAAPRSGRSPDRCSASPRRRARLPLPSARPIDRKRGASHSRPAAEARVRRSMYRAKTHGITVTVTPTYLEDQSDPDAGRWVWAYTVEIANGSAGVTQLRSRYWQITDANGHVEEVEGPGVVGEQPTLSPGDSFTYTSGCPLSTPSGFMRGRYRMEGPDGILLRGRDPGLLARRPAKAARPELGAMAACRPSRRRPACGVLSWNAEPRPRRPRSGTRSDRTRSPRRRTRR